MDFLRFGMGQSNKCNLAYVTPFPTAKLGPSSETRQKSRQSFSAHSTAAENKCAFHKDAAPLIVESKVRNGSGGFTN